MVCYCVLIGLIIANAQEGGKAMTKSTRACQAYSLARFGKTYAYIGEILGVSRQRAHQMVKTQSAKFGELPKRKTRLKKGGAV